MSRRLLIVCGQLHVDFIRSLSAPLFHTELLSISSDIGASFSVSFIHCFKAQTKIPLLMNTTMGFLLRLMVFF
jgi:hypothetical protein